MRPSPAPVTAGRASAPPPAKRQSTATPAGSQAPNGSTAATPAARKARTGCAVIHFSKVVIGARCGAGECPPFSVLVGIRQEPEIARALDRDRELPLVERARARNPARDDLAGFRDVGLQRRQVLVVDLVGAVGGELAELLAPEKT